MSHFEPFIKGERAGFVILQDVHFMAIIEEHPLALGHCVVFPKRMEDSILHLSELELASMMAFAKKVGLAIEKVISCKKIGLAAIGLQVRHAHLHLVPIQVADDLNFTRPKLEVTKNQLLDIAQKIRKEL